MFDSPPTCIISLANWNFNDSSVDCYKMISRSLQKRLILRHTGLSLKLSVLPWAWNSLSIPIIIYLLLLPVLFREKLYKHPFCGGTLPMKMTDLVVQRTFNREGGGEGGNYYFVDWYPRCRTQDSKWRVCMIKGFLGFKFSIPVYICVASFKWGRFIDKVPNCITAA